MRLQHKSNFGVTFVGALHGITRPSAMARGRLSTTSPCSANLPFSTRTKSAVVKRSFRPVAGWTRKGRPACRSRDANDDLVALGEDLPGSRHDSRRSPRPRWRRTASGRPSPAADWIVLDQAGGERAVGGVDLALVEDGFEVVAEGRLLASWWAANAGQVWQVTSNARDRMRIEAPWVRRTLGSLPAVTKRQVGRRDPVGPTGPHATRHCRARPGRRGQPECRAAAGSG